MIRYSSVVIFVMLVASSVLASIGSYRATQGLIVDDLNRALMTAVAERRSDWLAADTVKAYRHLRSVSGDNVALDYTDDRLCSHLSIPQLRHRAYMRVRILDSEQTACRSMPVDGGDLCSDTVVWQVGRLGTSMALKGYARCDMATVFGMSDQRLPLVLLIAAVMWAVMMSGPLGKRFYATVKPASCTTAEGCHGIVLGGIAMSSDGNSFRNADGTQVHFTPMQHTLMQMFFRAQDHSLTKTEICEALWPKKDDASETLYTLIKRLKNVVEADGRLRIETHRGRNYVLTVR